MMANVCFAPMAMQINSILKYFLTLLPLEKYNHGHQRLSFVNAQYEINFLFLFTGRL